MGALWALSRHLSGKLGCTIQVTHRPAELVLQGEAGPVRINGRQAVGAAVAAGAGAAAVSHHNSDEHKQATA